MKRIGVVLCAAAFMCVSVGFGWADKTAVYRSEKYNFVIEYPADWYVNEHSDQVDISSEEDAFEATGGAAGVTVLIEEAEPEDKGDPAKAFHRLSSELGDDVEFSYESTRVIGENEWFSVAFSGKDPHIEGTIYVLVRGGAVFLLGSFYTIPDGRSRYQSDVESMVDSFRFPPLEYKEFRDEKKGVSFQYPSNIEPIAQTEVVLLPLSGSNEGFFGSGGNIALGIVEPDEISDKKMTDAEILNFLAESSDLTISEKPTKVNVAGLTWLRAGYVHEEDGGRVTAFIHSEQGYTFAIILMAMPGSVYDTYEPIYQMFLDTLSLDPGTWAATMKAEDDD
ncbi:MAG TPA: hypothetical protein ENN69_01900 [Spirochaetia bacterium]|nr:hypothetical protein [Spirochaetia bacterium]